VKSPNDKLSLEQMQWFEWAIEKVKIPCEICRIKKIPVKSLSKDIKCLDRGSNSRRRVQSPLHNRPLDNRKAYHTA
ncbi:MAG: hypothetical protein ACFFDT_32195, partial [Candidatus Hodarchaeota archaeon]